MCYAMLLLAAPVFAGESKYEVYYFHASWRCGNCTNAEAWTRQVVDSLQASNPGVIIEFAPKQLETNADLVKATGAKRVDLIVAEVQDGKMVRHHNIGNLLDFIASKALVKKESIDGIIAFSGESKNLPRLNLPADYEKLQSRIDDPKKVGIFIVMKGARTANTPKVVETISEILERDYMPQLEEQSIIATMLDSDNPKNKDFLGELNAQDGNVVVALLGVEDIEDSITLDTPKDGEPTKDFESAFIEAMGKNLTLGGLD